MRKLGYVLLIILLVAVPVAARNGSPTGYYRDLSTIAWLEGKTVEVALVNESNSRVPVTVATNTMDNWYRPVIEQRTVYVPARTIIIESFELSNRWDNEPISLNISRNYQYEMRVQVQVPDIFSPSAYLVRSGEIVDIDVDIAQLLGQSEDVVLTIDQYYDISGSNSRGRIEVKTLEGGFTYNSYRNTIEYTKPQMALSLRTPQISNVAAVTFGLTKELSGYRWRSENVEGPTILVYGRNVRFGDSRQEPPRRPSLIVR